MQEQSDISFSDYLPTQGAFREYFSGSTNELTARIFNAMTDCSGFQHAETRFNISFPEQNVPFGYTPSPPASLHLLEFLVALLQPRHVLEVGTYLGISSLYMAQGLPRGGDIITLEKYDIFAEAARRNFAANGASDRITCITGDAWESIQLLESDGRVFDLIFLDANKERYLDYFNRLAGLLVPGGLFIVDDAFMQGDVFNEAPKTAKGVGVRALLDVCHGLEGWGRFVLPLSDGFLLLLKPRSDRTPSLTTGGAP